MGRFSSVTLTWDQWWAGNFRALAIFELWIHNHPNKLKKRKRHRFAPWRWLGSELISNFFFFFHFFCCTLGFSQHLPLGPGNASCGLSRRRPPCRNVNTLWIKPLGSCRTASLLCQQEPPPQWEFKIRKTEVYSIYHTVVSLACPAECFSHLFFFRLFSMTGYITTYWI